MSVVPQASDRVLVEWRNRVAAEYTSAAIAARVLHLGIACGLDRALLETLRRVVGDELDHASLSDETRLALGDADAPLGLDVARLTPEPHPDGPLADLLHHILQSFCLGETFAVPLFQAMRTHATHPAVQPMITRVLRDEAVHRQVGWDTLDALLELDPEGVRERAAAWLPSLFAGYRAAYRDLPDAPPLSDHERAAGLLPLDDYRRIHDETVQDVILPRLAARGVHIV